jgi:hypothetical protein
MIQIKDYTVLKSLMLYPYHPKMVALAIWASHRYSSFCITSGFRENDKGVHGTTPCRAIDIRSRNYNDPQSVVDDINNHWVYNQDSEFKCALYHDVGQGAHIHLQVHPNTIYTKDQP